jgi:outer membrane protein assembly factor BamB
VIQIDGASAQLQSHYPAGNFRTTPTVADVDGDGHNEIIVENAAGFIELLDPPRAPGARPMVRWKFRGYAQPVWVTWKTGHAALPAVDLDGDGKKELICCDAGDEPHTTIYALRADGSIYWKSALAGLGPRLTESFRVGRFREEGWDILMTIQASTQPEMLCLDGRTGEVRWHKRLWKDDKGQTWPYPNQWACYDADADGYHEIYGSYAYIYYVLDGSTGEPLRKPINIWHEVFHRWQSYFTPISADYNGDGQTEFLLASNSFAIGGLAVVTPTMEILWEKALDNSIGARGLQGVGDCDGDGIPDIAFYHLDGRIACYDGKTGEMKWQVAGLQSHGSMSGGHFASGDIDSDGRDEFLYPLGSNEIIALDHDAPNHILWRAHLSAEPDTPILADIDGDGFAELIVCTTDGYLNVLKSIK